MPDRVNAAAPHLLRHWRPALVALALLVGAAARLSYYPAAPLWLDETFSAVIAGQHSFGDAVRWCLDEVTGPGFYLPLWAWVQVAGGSNLSLRIPSIICAIGAPVLIYLRGHPDRDVRTLWAVFVALWAPAAMDAVVARPYPQIFLLGVVQIILFRRLIEVPSRSRALHWALVTAFALLTSYNAAAISGVQGVLYLARHRRAALATWWPAVLPLAVTAAWIAAHLSVLMFLVVVLRAYDPLPLSAAATLPAILFGAPLHGAIILGAMAVTGALYWRPKAPLDATGIAALSGLIAVGVIFALAFVRPGFAARYLMPSMPGLLFAVAVWARWQARRDWKPVLVLLAILLAGSAGLVRSNLSEPDGDRRHAFNFEAASAWIDAARPQRLIFYWDGPAAAASKADRLGEVGGYFLARAGQGVPVDVPRAWPDAEPNAAVLAMANRHPGAAILWIANDRLGPERVPRIATLDARYECQEFGNGVTVTACRMRVR